MAPRPDIKARSFAVGWVPKGRKMPPAYVGAMRQLVSCGAPFGRESCSKRKSSFSPTDRKPQGRPTPFSPAGHLPTRAWARGRAEGQGGRGYPGRHDGLPGAGLRCTFAQRGWFGGFHDGSVMLRSQSEQSEPWTYACTADMRAGRPGRPEPSRHCMRAAAVSAFSWGFVHIVREMHTLR